MQYKICILWRK